MPNQYNDSSIPYGSRQVNFKRISAGGGSGQTTTFGTALASAVVMENISVSRKLREGSRYDEVGKPNGSWGVQDFAEGSAVAQLATGASSYLQEGDGFATTFDSVLGSESFVLTGVDTPEEQLGYKKQSLRFKKLYNTTIAP